MSYRSFDRTTRQTKSSTDADDSRPPNISYATDKHSGSHDEESDSDEWEEEEASTSSVHGPFAIDSTEWEDVALSPAEALMFEEERKAALRLQAGGPAVELKDEFERRVWRLDYDSTYADMKALANMSSVRRSQVAAASSTGLLQSQHKAEPQGGRAAETKEGEPSAGVTASLLGTLSSLWSSTFGTK